MTLNPKPWSALTNFHTPLWLKEDKSGIYTHWGVYSVAAFGPNVSCYPHLMYQEGTAPWKVAAEGPTGTGAYGDMSELRDIEYQPKDIRFTLKDDVIYAIFLGEIGGGVIINS
ncbi:MAG: alpha-L-fucosidase, partial [Treponema sp.]|nr:alpha-L-fucosidase [Treponema sp.]